MTEWASDGVARILGTARVAPRTFGSIDTDTRRLQPGSLFVALRGERFDGHDFLEQARAAGAAGAVVRRGTTPVSGLPFFEVDDTLVALGLFARARRRRVAGPVVGVTGSNGKTSTKEMIARVLGTRWRVHATRANLNNLVGVPLTILEAPEETEALVIEAGANTPGEVARLRTIIEPTIGVVTNVSHAHLAGFGSLDGVMAEKVALVEGAPLAVVGTEPRSLADAARRVTERVVCAGLSEEADVHPERWSLDAEGHVTLRLRGQRIHLPVIGRHQGDNAMLALTVGLELELDVQAVGSAIASVTVPAGRLETVRRGNLVILNDTYNSNPASLLASLDVACNIRGRRPLVVVVGSMLELGEHAAWLHDDMARAVVDAGPNLVGVIGAFVPAFEPYRAQLEGRLVTAEDVETLGRAVGRRLHGDELVLLKASRGVGLDRAIPYLTPDSEEPCSITS